MAGTPSHTFQAYQPPAQPSPAPAPSQPHHGQGDVDIVSPLETGAIPPFPLPGQDRSPPPPPAHRSPVAPPPGSTYSAHGPPQGPSQPLPQPPYGSPNYSNFSPPGTNGLGESAAGGGIYAADNRGEGGAQALRDVNGWGRSGDGSAAGARGAPWPLGADSHDTPFADHYGYEQSRAMYPPPSYGHLPAGAMPRAPPSVMSSVTSSSNSEHGSIPLVQRSSPHESLAMYQDNPYNRYSSSNLNLAPRLGAINTNEADEDDDWGMGPQRANTQSKRRSFLPFATSRDASREGTGGAAAAAGAAGVAGAAVGTGAGATAFAHTRDGSGDYNAVPGGLGFAAAGDGQPELLREKSEWLSSQKQGKKRLRWIVGTLIVLVIIGAIVGGVLGATLNKGGKDSSSGGSGSGSTDGTSAEEDNKTDLHIKSAEIQKLMNNKELHKVFPGMDYTPLNTQYPDCIENKPSQNNVTRDMALLSQLTNAVRLYGTDCNQTEMVLHAIDKLELTDMKVWLGVWLGANDTTNKRQLKQMYKILDDYDEKSFKGIIVGNEVLYRKDLTETELFSEITKVKANLTKKGINLKVGTADLGDNWKSDLASKVDIVMSNVHPFFAGVTAEKATAWTLNFWKTTDVVLTQNDASIQQIIAEVGWPSEGGNDCGASDCTTKTEGSVASIDNMNTFMEDWICPSLENGTEYFWFEAFDEPWKVRFNEDDKNWEDKWGLMDVNRNLKKGVKIPDCGGATAK